METIDDLAPVTVKADTGIFSDSQAVREAPKPKPMTSRELLDRYGVKAQRLIHEGAPATHASFSVDGRNAETMHVDDFVSGLRSAHDGGYVQDYMAKKFPRHG